MKHKLIIIFIFLLFCHTLTAQKFNFINIGTDRGLPSSEVYHVLQDSKGYMWFSTNYGVSRYNGKKFTTYTTAQGLTDNSVLTMCEDNEGRIWFGPQNNEICYWQDDTIYTLPSGKTLSKTLARASVYLLGMYADSNNTIWLSTDYGLYVSEGIKKYSTIQKFANDDSCSVLLKIIEGKKIMVALQAPSAQYLLSPVTHFIGYDTPSGRKYTSFKKLSNYTDPIILRTALLNDGRVLYAYGNVLYIIFPDGKVEKKQFDRAIITLNADKDKGLWIGFFKGGLSYYKNQDINTLPVHCLEKYSVSSVCKDHEGGVWATTIERGVFYTPAVSVFTYPNIPEVDDHITFLGGLNNKIIVSTLGRNIFAIDSMQFIKPFTVLTKMRGKKESLNALKIIQDTVYIGFGGKVWMTDKFLKPIKIYNNVFPKDLIVTNDHTIWLLMGGAMMRLDKHNQQKPGVVYPTSFRLTCAIVERDSGLYVGSKSGLYLFRNGHYSRLDSIDPLLKTQIMHMKRDSHNNIWLATVGEGVLVVKENKVIQRINSKNGLISDICNRIEIDKYSNVWVGAPNGLSCIKKGTERLNNYSIKNITNQNGLNNNEVTTLYANDNTLWVGTISGISSVDISNATITAPPSQVYLKAVQINNMPVSKNDSVFKYNQNNIRLVLEGLTFSDNSGHRYRYRLNGFDTTWKETRSEIIEFNNLPSGTYTFLGEVANADGIWSKHPVAYSFSINQPFWKRWWFILLEIAALAFAIHLFIHFRTGIITKREQEKTSINKLLAEYQMKALRAQMNPHFIFNAINSIQNFILLKDSTHAYDYLTKFSRLIRFVLISTKENEMTLKQEMEILSLYVELEQLRFENAFEYIFHIDKIIDTETVVIPGLLIQPYVENAIWHGLMPLKEHKGILDISIRAEMKTLKIIIKDNGVGRERSSKIQKKITHQSMGMDLNNKRVELFTQGSEATSIVVKDIYKNNGEPAGTSVEITLPMIESY